MACSRLTFTFTFKVNKKKIRLFQSNTAPTSRNTRSSLIGPVKKCGPFTSISVNFLMGHSQMPHFYISAIISLVGRRNQFWCNTLPAAHCYRRLGSNVQGMAWASRSGVPEYSNLLGWYAVWIGNVFIFRVFLTCLTLKKETMLHHIIGNHLPDDMA